MLAKDYVIRSCILVILIFTFVTTSSAATSSRNPAQPNELDQIDEHLRKSSEALSTHTLILSISAATLGAGILGFGTYRLTRGVDNPFPYSLQVLSIGVPLFLGAGIFFSFHNKFPNQSIEFQTMAENTTEERQRKLEKGEELLREFNYFSKLFRYTEAAAFSFGGVIALAISFGSKSYKTIPIGTLMVAAGYYRFFVSDTPEKEHDKYFLSRITPSVSWNSLPQGGQQLLFGISSRF